MDVTNNFDEDMKKCCNAEVYNQEHDAAINGSVDKLVEYLEREFPYQALKLKDQYPKLNCAEGESYVNFTLSYNLVLALLTKLFGHSDQANKEALRDMLDNDIAELVDGPMTDEQLAAAEQEIRNQTTEV